MNPTKTLTIILLTVIVLSSFAIAFEFGNVSATSTLGVYFNETGLPTGTSWSVTLNGTPYSSTSSTIFVPEDNGFQGSFIINPVEGYTVTSFVPSSGNVIVAITPAVVTIVFSGAATYDLTMYTVGEGTVNPGNQSDVAQGTNFDLEAIPADGWAFSGWSNDSSGHSNTTISMDADKVVTATFIPTYNLTMNIYVDEILLDTEMDTFNAGYVRNGYVNLDALLPEWTFDHLRIDDTNITGTTFSITMDQNHVLERF